MSHGRDDEDIHAGDAHDSGSAHGDGHDSGHSDHSGNDDSFGHSNAHGAEPSYESEFDSELLEPSGIVSDLFFGEDETRTIDLSEFFPVSKILAVRHNDGRLFNDVRRGTPPVVNLASPRTLRIKKLRSKRMSDILRRKDCAASLAAYVDKNRVVRVNPIVLSTAAEVPDFGIDVRSLETIPKTRTYPDIFFHPLPFSKRAFRYAKKRRKTILKALGGGVVFGCLLVGGTYAAAISLQTGVERAYAGLFELKSFSGSAKEFLEKAEELDSDFSALEWRFFPIETLLDSPAFSLSMVRTAGRVIHGGKHLSKGVMEAARVRSDFETAVFAYDSPVLAFASGSTFKLTDFIRSERPRLERLNSALSSALEEYSGIQSLGDPALDAKFQDAVTKLLSEQERLRFALSKLDAVLLALWDVSPQRYLILNQNRDELRATGGFPGSAVFVELYKGRLSKYEKKDIYYYDWHLFPFAPKSPAGIDQVSEKWGLRDANYFPEMSRNFEVVDRFYQKSGGSSLNGLIVLNQSLITDLLAEYGPVRLDSINKTVTAENFSTLLSVLVENRVRGRESAKDILFEFVAEFEKILLQKKEYAKYFDIALSNAKSGEMLAYSNVGEVEALFEEIFPGEHAKHFEGNFVSPIFTSISGNKSDRYVQRKFKIEAKPIETSNGSCRVLNHFSIESDHAMTVDDKEKIRRLLYEFKVPIEAHEKQIFIQGNGTNKQYVRVLVPKGSKLVGTAPIQMETDDSNPEYTVFSFYLTTEVAQVSGAFFDYESSPEECVPTPKFYRQPGLSNYSVETR